MMTANQYGGPPPNVGLPPPTMQHQQDMTRNNQQHFSNNQQQQQQQRNGQQEINNVGGGGQNNANPGQQQQHPGPINLRVILTKDEVAFLFGFDGQLLNQLRQQTRANIQLTDGDSFEYVLLINGPIEIIFKAFSLVCRKLWDLLCQMAGGPGHNRPLKIRIAVPAVQCGSIIGKAGAKVKEIRDLTGAQIQVSHEPLPNSNERCVEISGAGDQCVQAAYHVCGVIQDTPLRGEVMPYVPPVSNPPPPHPHQARMPQGPPLGPPPGGPGPDSWRPVFLCGDKAYIIDGGIARPAPPELLRNELAKTPLGGEVAQNVANNLHMNIPDHMNPLALMAAIGKSQQVSGMGGGHTIPKTSREMTVNSEMINVMMAKGQGQKLQEIQRMSGAQIHISDQVQSNGECLMTLSGSEESILLAQFLIQSNVEAVMKERQQQQQLPSGPLGPGGGGGGPGIPQENNIFQPTNQFDPSIMQQNFNNDQHQQGFHQDNNSRGNFNSNNQQRDNFNDNSNRFGGGHRGRGRGERRGMRRGGGIRGR